MAGHIAEVVSLLEAQPGHEVSWSRGPTVRIPGCPPSIGQFRFLVSCVVVGFLSEVREARGVLQTIQMFTDWKKPVSDK